MRIYKQLRLVSCCFIILILLIVLLFASGVFGVNTLVQRQVLVDHTNYVLNEIELSERAFSDADYAGRNQIIAGETNPKIEAFRQVSFEKLANLKEAVKDNPVQTDNIESLETIIRSNYKVQDEQLGSVVKTDSSITYKLDQTAQRIKFTETINALFMRIKINEMTLLRDDRMPRLTMWQWRLVYFTSSVVAMLFLVTVALFVFHIRLLRRQIQVIAFMDDLNHRSEQGEIGVHRDLAKLRELLHDNSPIQVQ